MSKSTKTHVRMFDGAKWDTYRVGSKKHRAAEQRRAAFEAVKATTKSLNGEIASFLRSNGIAPKGRAWTEVKAAVTEASDLLLLTEKNLDRLRKLNRKDGIENPPALVPTKKAKAKANAVLNDVEKAAEVGTKRGKVAKRRSKAAKKAYRTRVANGTVRRVNGRFAPATPVEAPKPKGKKALFWASLDGTGLTEAQIEAAWKVRQSA